VVCGEEVRRDLPGDAPFRDLKWGTLNPSRFCWPLTRSVRKHNKCTTLLETVKWCEMERGRRAVELNRSLNEGKEAVFVKFPGRTKQRWQPPDPSKAQVGSPASVLRVGSLLCCSHVLDRDGFERGKLL
jgi:hypothetical protein